ncbi:hypothetical protein [Ornithinibacillus bavariensis]|uniref:hypothetical protein n=1 Tax=Ornithinibacillus bavariensis TaxID=545502 RepID=UPI000EE2A82F|nr:hypothetical protein [Ornithinibacillus sp.]
MKLHEHFLPADMVEASKQYHCSKDCIEKAFEHLENGDFELAKQRLTDALLSTHELSKMERKKLTLDRYNAMIQEMIQKGIHIQVVRGIFHERKFD